MTSHENWIKSEMKRCEPFIQRAIDRADGLYNYAYVEDSVLSGESQFWPAPNSALVTKIENYPTGARACLYWLAGGDLKELSALEKVVSAWAKKQGCDRVYIMGREGWLRSLDGFSKKEVMMSRKL